MTCEHAHEHVIATGRCRGCGSALTGSGPLDIDTGTGIRFLGPPYAFTEALRCRTGGSHLPDTASGACLGCPTRVEAFSDPTTDHRQLRWFETTY